MKSLEKIRKMPSFGYIFCCKPADVKGVLDGFPQFTSKYSDLITMMSSTPIPSIDEILGSHIPKIQLSFPTLETSSTPESAQKKHDIWSDEE